MPVYNAAPFLAETLNSIIEQSLKDWELIAIDDFSRDDSKQILEAFAECDHRIKVFSNEEKGIIPALEKAYKLAQGKYITRMDADDIMPVDKLESLVKILDGSPDVCATGYVEYFSEDEVFDGYKRYAEWLNALVDKDSHYEDIYRECVVPSPCWMMRRDALVKIGGITSNRYPEDYDLVFRMYEHKVPIVGVEKVLHLWRDHSSRASRNDENYADQSFLELKMYYFLNIDFDENQQLVVWGAGRAGKEIAKKLIAQKIRFHWVTDNEKKIGLDIYNVKMESTKILENIDSSQIILAVKQKGFREENMDKITQLAKDNRIFPFY